MRVFRGSVGSAGVCRGRKKPSAFGGTESRQGVGRNHGLIALPVNLARTLQFSQLPDHHRDPFDRMLVAQAMTEPMFLLTSDRALASYGAFVRMV